MPMQVRGGHSDTVVIAKQKDERYGFLVVLGTLTLLMLLTLVGWKISDPRSLANISHMTVMVGVIVCITLVISYVNLGPREIHLYPHTRRYRFINGLPFFVRTTEGPFEDIARFVISTYEAGRGVSTNQIEVLWAVAGRKPTFLRFLNLTAAYEVKDAIEKQAGLPLVWKD